MAETPIQDTGFSIEDFEGLGGSDSVGNAPGEESEAGEVEPKADTGVEKDDLLGESESRVWEKFREEDPIDAADARILEAFRGEGAEYSGEEGLQLPEWLRGPTEEEKEAVRHLAEESAEKVRDNAVKLNNKFNSVMRNIRDARAAKNIVRNKPSTQQPRQQNVSLLRQMGQRKEALEKSREEVTSLVDEAKVVQEETFKGPSHEEIMEVYEHGTQKMCTEISVGSVKSAMEKLNYTREVNGETEYSLANAQRFEGGKLPESDGSGPEVFFKHVKNSDEVVIITRLNNAVDGGEGTVVVMNASLDTRSGREGLIDWEKPRLHLTLSEERHNYFAVEEPKSLKGRFHNGEYTVEEYKDRYRKKNRFLPFGKGGKTLSDYWKKRDAQVGRSQEGWKAIENKDGLLEDLREAYVGTLVERSEESTHVIEKTEKERKTLEEKKKKKRGPIQIIDELGDTVEIEEVLLMELDRAFAATPVAF